jgi:thiamine-monophosphate kinase
MKPHRASPDTEASLIRVIQNLSQRKASPRSRLALSIGDDTAAFRGSTGSLTLLSTDALVEGIHFDLHYFSPEDIGWKALAVNLSDIAAMGGNPLYFTTSIAVPPDKPSTWVRKLYRGMLRLASEFQVRLIGGDTCASPQGLFLDVTIIGEVKPSEMVTRKGSRPGDILFVTGELGGSAMGLEMLRRHSRLAKRYPEAIHRHLRPRPRSLVGRFLASHKFASALIDISDGLSTDLHHLCEQSRVGAVIDAQKIPLPGSATRLAPVLAKTTLDYALNGGEDYELLFTVPAKLRSRIPPKIDGVAIHEIGWITKEAGGCSIIKQGRTEKVSPGGFDHFIVGRGVEGGQI